MTQRGCGSLEHDALYANWKLGAGGVPISQTMLCPIWRLDRKKLGISYNGVTLLARVDHAGQPVYVDNKIVYDVFDVAGRKHYKYKADFFEEGRVMGFNRRLPTNTPFDLLMRGHSLWYICTDAGAYDYGDYPVMSARVEDDDMSCRKYPGRVGHRVPFDALTCNTCTAMWWHEYAKKDCIEVEEGLWFRQMPWGKFRVYPQEKEPKWEFGAFIVLPVANFVATTKKNSDQLGRKVNKATETLRNSGFGVQPVRL